MSLKRSQDYLYFQNKASHYHNIVSARSRIDTRAPSTLNNTIDCTNVKPSFKHQPPLRQFDIEFQNKNMIKRIMSKQKSPLNRYSTYARFNQFQRSFRLRNPQKKEEQRIIQLENQKLKKSIEKAKSLVGSVHKWKHSYDQNMKHSRLISRFSNGKLKDQLLVDTQNHLPQKYLKFIQNVQNQNSNDNQTSSSRQKKKTKIEVEKLFILPQINVPKAQKNLQQQKLSNSKELKSKPNVIVNQEVQN